MNSHMSLWSILVGKIGGKMVNSSISVGSERLKVLGKVLIAFSRSASSLLTSILGMGDDSVETLATEEVGLMTCVITQCGIGAMGGTKAFGHLVKKDWRQGCDLLTALSLFFFSSTS